MNKAGLFLVAVFALFNSFIFPVKSYGQDSANEDSIKISAEVLDFFNSVESFHKRYLLPKQDGIIPPDEIIKITKSYYNCVLQNPKEYLTFISKRTIDNDRPAPILSKLRQKIGEYYSYTYSDLLTIPYLLRVKIIDPLQTNYQTKELSWKPKKIQMISIIEDIIKGEEYFNVSDTISISYLSSWNLCISSTESFWIGKSYLIPVNFWDNTSDNYRFAETGDMCSIYPIENDIVSVPGDYFDLGERASWKEFRKQMISYYTKMPADTFSSYIKRRNREKVEEMNCEELTRYAELCQNNTLIDIVAEMPQLINENDTSVVKLIYPADALKNKIEGKLFVSTIVDLSGIPRCSKILMGSLGYNCEEEAIRYVSSLRFSICRLPYGKPIVVRMVVPVKFELPK